MKLPSINYLLSNAKASFLRFPLTIISSLIAAILAIYLIEMEPTNKFPYINVMLSMSIAIPLFFCVTIVANKKELDKKSTIIFNVLATLILVIIYFTLPTSESTHNTSMPYIKYGLYNITCHLLVSFIPFIFSTQLNAFWHYNKILFIRILSSITYSGFIYVGLIVALTALHLLFDIKIHDKLYIEIWIGTMTFFNTWFFVGGIPYNFDQLDSSDEYPKGLKIFSQYVLLPLLGLYVLILYSYGAKIFILWNWPKGIVSYLIIFVSVLGILTFLLLYPYGNQKENYWIKKASKGYYFLLFPLLVILFIAIFMRINEYGITINRYAILVLGIWITIVCFYTAFGKTNIKFIPTSLAIMLILVSFGPWGMFAIGEQSQINRLKNILEQSKILVANRIQNEPIWTIDSLNNLHSIAELKNEGRLPDSLHNEVKSILDYLDNFHGFSSIKQWYKQDIDSIINIEIMNKKNNLVHNEAEIYMKTLGLKYEHTYAENTKKNIAYNAGTSMTIKTVSGYDYLVNFTWYNYAKENNNICNFYIDSVEYNLVQSTKIETMLLLQSKGDTINFRLEDLLNKLQKNYGSNPDFVLPISTMELVHSNNKFEVKIAFHTIEMERKKGGLQVNNLAGDLYIKKQ